jgi:hypothetical protein
MLIILGVLIAGFFGLRAVFGFREFRRYGPPAPLVEAPNTHPLEIDVELIRDWMTIPYISRTYQVDPKMLFDAIGISQRGNEGKSLLQLNEEFSPNAPGIVIELVKATIKANQPFPTVTMPDPPTEP